MPTKPRNIILLISDSLRFDTVYDAGIGMPYIQQNAAQFTELRSGGCWTLPATASLFTGLLPHEHGATEQTRAIHTNIPTLAERMREAGYSTHQVSANIATTHIFGLDRGFDEVIPVWKIMKIKVKYLAHLFGILSKPRMRKQFLAGDFISRKISEDFDSAKVWAQSTHDLIFDKAREIIRQNEAKGKPSFLFLNLMETHFPYHISDKLELDSFWLWNKLKEIADMFKYSNQKFLINGKQDLSERRLQTIFSRQRRAWQRLAPRIDEFCREFHQGTGNLVLFGSDHGENFGDEGWNYHFSNVTDAGNKIPFFWLDHDAPQARIIPHQGSARHIYNSLMQVINRPAIDQEVDLLRDPERSLALMESFWYNNDGKTKSRYKFNQFSFLYQDKRFLWRNNVWFEAPFQTSYERPDFRVMDPGVNPLQELRMPKEQKDYLSAKIREFEAFAATIPLDKPLLK